MSTARRLAILSASVLATLVLSAAVPGPEEPNWRRLRSMPREERVRLADKLKAFDALPTGDQEAVRALDRAIAAEPEENRANDFAVLRRYHLWLGGLTEAQRADLGRLPSDKRM